MIWETTIQETKSPRRWHFGWQNKSKDAAYIVRTPCWPHIYVVGMYYLENGNLSRAVLWSHTNKQRGSSFPYAYKSCVVDTGGENSPACGLCTEFFKSDKTEALPPVLCVLLS
jgi:hypothetical protein